MKNRYPITRWLLAAAVPAVLLTACSKDEVPGKPDGIGTESGDIRFENGGSRPAADTGNDRFGLHERMGGRGRDRRFRRCQRNSAVGDRFGQLHPQCETDLQRQFMDAGRAAVLAEDRREHNGSRFLRLLSLQRVGCRPHGDSL